MAEYIEREVVERLLGKLFMEPPQHDGKNYYCGIAVARQEIQEIPTADVVEVRHGEWIKKEDGHYVCSECGRTRPYSNYTYAIENWACNYCRWCGAKMDGKGEG